MDELEQEREENPHQEVADRIFIRGTNFSGGSITQSLDGVTEDDPFLDYYRQGDLGKMLTIYSETLKVYDRDGLGGMLEHELGHVINTRITNVPSRDLTLSVERNASEFGRNLDLSYEDIEEKIQAELTNYRAKNNDLSKESIAEISSYLAQEEGDIRKSLFNKGDKKNLRRLDKLLNGKDLKQDDILELLYSYMETVIRSNYPSKLIELDLDNKDFVNYIEQASVIIDKADSLVEMIDFLSETPDTMSTHELAQYIADKNMTAQFDELTFSFYEYTEAAEKVYRKPSQVETIVSKPKLNADGEVIAELVILDPSPYALNRGEAYVLPKNISDKDREKYLEIFKKIQDNAEIISSFSERIEKLANYNEAAADLNIDDNILGALKFFKNSKRRFDELSDVDKALVSIFNSAPVHPGVEDRIEYLENKARMKVEEAKDVHAMLIADGNLSQEDVDLLVEIGGDLIKIQNSNTGTLNDKIGFYDVDSGEIKSTATFYENDEVKDKTRD